MFIAGFGIMVFNASFNNVSVLLVGKPEYSKKTTDLSQVTDKHYHIMLHQLHHVMSGVRTHNFIMFNSLLRESVDGPLQVKLSDHIHHLNFTTW